MDVMEKLVELHIEDALLVLREEHRQRTDSYTTYLAHGGKGDPAEEVGIDALAMAISALEKTKWISVDERLPEPEQEVFVCVRTKISNYRYVCCAMHVPENWHRQSSDFCWDFECCDEYDEEQDDFIVTPGWYESIHNWDDYSVVGIEDIVTHWMPLPPPPKGE